MPFVITQPKEEDEEVVDQQSGFVITPSEKVEEETDTSVMRGVGGAIQDFFMKGLDIGVRAFGGGPESMMAQQQIWEEVGRPRLERQLQEMELQEKGMSDEEILSQLGEWKEPELPIQSFTELGDVITGGTLVPRTAAERGMRQSGGTAGEFVAATMLMPGGGQANLGKEAAIGGLFGAGEAVAEESGGGPASQFFTGLSFASLPFLLKRGAQGLQSGIQFGKRLLGAKGIPEGMPKFLEEVGEKAVADLELSSRDLMGRVAKTSEENLAKFDEAVSKVAEPTMKEAGPFRAAEIEKEIIKDNQKAILDQISPAAESKKKSWEGLQQYVEGNFNAIKETYSRLYEAVEEGVKGLGVVPNRTFETASKVVEDLEKSLIKAPEEGGVKKALEDVVRLLKPMQQGSLVEVPVEQLMAGKRSINRLLEKSDIVPAPIDLLKPVSSAMKQDVMKALEARPGVKRAFEAAENQFAEAQKVFNNDAIVKMRKSQNPEDLTSMFTKPSNLERLNEAIGGNQQVKDFLDRLVVENIASKNKALAQELASESREYLSKKSSQQLDKLLEYGDSLSSPGQQALARGNILGDIQKAFDTGARPDYTLKLMQNPIGYDMVKETINRSPRGKKMFKSLQRMTFEDMVSSVLDKEKQIDFEKAKDILANPHMKSVIKEAMGQDGLKFFQNLERYGKNMAENMRALAIKDRPLMQRVLDNYFDKSMKYALYAAAPFTLGKSLIPVLGADVAKRAYRAKLYRILEDPQSQKIIQEMGQKNVSSAKMANLMKRFAQVAGRLGKEEEE